MDKRQLFESYITQNIDSAYRFAYTYMKNKEDAEDVVTESVIKALKAVGGLRNPEYIKTWFYRIVANTAISFLRQNKKITKLDYAELNLASEEEEPEGGPDLEKIIAKLDEDHRVIIVLRFFEGMKLAEIAKVLDINENTVKTRLYRALKTLRVDMEMAL